MSLVLTPLVNVPVILEGDDLAEVVVQGLADTKIALDDGDILVITQKIVSKSEGRTKSLAGIVPSSSALKLAAWTGKDPRLVELILDESGEVLRAGSEIIIAEHKMGFVCANAGIDQSNVCSPDDETQGIFLLLPRDADYSAERIRKTLTLFSGKRIGVMIIDSQGRPWRKGTAGSCIGLSGVPAIVDLRGQKDLFGRRLTDTCVAVADELAAAASLVMGQAAEGFAIIHVRGFPYELRESSIKEILRPKHKELFR